MLSIGGMSFDIWASNLEISDETMRVTAHRFTEPIVTVLAPRVVVNRAQIERWQSPSLPDILQRLPGITMTRNGGLGQWPSVLVRGTTSGSRVLLLVDGIRLPSTGVTSAFDFSQIPVGLIQRIEYIRGPLAAMYGSDAIGGVINIITESQNTRNNVNVSYGLKDYQHYTAAKCKDSNFDVFPTQSVVLRAIYVLDMAFHIKFCHKLWIRGKIMNIFNTYYETVFSYPSLGRELFFTLSYDF